MAMNSGVKLLYIEMFVGLRMIDKLEIVLVSCVLFTPYIVFKITE